jgi:hypothetical protein
MGDPSAFPCAFPDTYDSILTPQKLILHELSPKECLFLSKNEYFCYRNGFNNLPGPASRPRPNAFWAGMMWSWGCFPLDLYWIWGL